MEKKAWLPWGKKTIPSFSGEIRHRSEVKIEYRTVTFNDAFRKFDLPADEKQEY